MNLGFIRRNSKDKVSETQEKKLLDGYVWVDGFKGTDANMQGKNNFQYELGKDYTCDGEPEICKNGFHLSLTLKDVCDYIPFEKPSNRYFKVDALVSGTALQEYGASTPIIYHAPVTKLVAKKIVFTREITNEEFYNAMIKDKPKYKYVRSLKDYEAFKNQDKEWINYFLDKETKRLEGKYTSQFVEVCLQDQKFDMAMKFIDVADALYNEGISPDVRIPWLLNYVCV